MSIWAASAIYATLQVDASYFGAFLLLLTLFAFAHWKAILSFSYMISSSWNSSFSIFFTCLPKDEVRVITQDSIHPA